MKFPFSPLIILLLLWCAPTSHAQHVEIPVSFQIVNLADKVKVGEEFNIVVQADIQGEWHLYSINNDPDAGPYPTKFQLVGSDAEIVGEIQESNPVIEYDPNFDTELGWHNKSAEFIIPTRFNSGASPNKRIEIEIFFQACTDDFCLPPKNKTIEGEIVVEE